MGTKTLLAAKKIGRNIVVTIDKKKYSRQATEDDIKLILKKAEMYNKKPSDTLKNSIIKMMTPAEVKAKEEKDKTKAKAKGLKQQIKKEVKKSGSKKADTPKFDLLAELEKTLTEDETAVDKFQKLLDKFKKMEVAPAAAVTQTPTRREH